MSVASSISSVDPGFSNPAVDAQRVFRSMLQATSRPGNIVTLDGAEGTGGLGSAAASAALALVDFDTPVWLSAGLYDHGLPEWLRFHCGAPLTDDLSAAAFVLLDGAPDPEILNKVYQGDPKYPDLSATIIAELPALEGGQKVTLQGPGIKESIHLYAEGLGTEFWQAWDQNNKRFPLGVDLFLCACDALVGLPRTTRRTPQ